MADRKRDRGESTVHADRKRENGIRTTARSSRKRGVSIRDISEVAGVSIASVSKALNHKPDVSEELKKRIFSICDEFGYQLNSSIQDLARSAGDGTTQNIAFVMVGRMFSDPAYAQVIDGIYKAAKQRNLNLLLEWLSGDEEHIYDLSAVLRERRIDGIILTGEINHSVITILTKLHIPYVILGTYHQALTCSCTNVLIDMGPRMQRIVREIVDRGNRAIAYVAGEVGNYFQTEMLRAFRESLIENGLQPNDDLIFLCDSTEFCAMKALAPTFRLPVLPFDSIVTPNFSLAVEISYLIMARFGVDSEPDIPVGTFRRSKSDIIPVPAVYQETHFDKVAEEAVDILADPKSHTLARTIILNP